MRGRRRLELGRENGYLNARSADSIDLLTQFGFWCWRLKLPVVWFERRSPNSRYGRVRLDMSTTPNMLTATGQAAMREVATGKMKVLNSAHDACLDYVPLGELERVARAAVRIATRPGNYEPNRPKVASIEVARTGKLFPVERTHAASA